MAKQPPYGGKKKNVGSPTAAAQRQIISSYARSVAGASRNATSAKRVADAGFQKFGDFLAAKDVTGRGRGIAAKQRQADLKKYVAATGAAGVASGYGTVGAKKKSTKKVGSAAAEVRAAKNAKLKRPRVPKTM